MRRRPKIVTLGLPSALGGTRGANATKGTPTEVDVPFALSVRRSGGRSVKPSNRHTVKPSNRYLHAGSPSPAPPTTVFVVFTPMPQVKFGICECVTVADQ